MVIHSMACSGEGTQSPGVCGPIVFHQWYLQWQSHCVLKPGGLLVGCRQLSWEGGGVLRAALHTSRDQREALLFYLPLCPPTEPHRFTETSV